MATEVRRHGGGDRKVRRYRIYRIIKEMIRMRKL